MTEQNEPKNFNHDKGGISDKITLVSELEHARRHALRSAVASWKEEDDSESLRYLLIAKRAQSLRREYMRKHFPDIKESDWCLCKTAACLRQLAYEVCEGDSLELKEIDDLVDDIWGTAIGEDLTACESCRDDKGVVE